jgi:hypothetical protein
MQSLEIGGRVYFDTELLNLSWASCSFSVPERGSMIYMHARRLINVRILSLILLSVPFRCITPLCQ